MVPVIRWAALVVAVVLAATVSACASGAALPGTPASTTPSAAATRSTVVRLSGGFAPDKLRLAVGQSFLLIVSPGVQTTIPPASNLLTQRPIGAGRYLYTAHASGSTTLSAIVRPRCPPGTMCPMWIAVAHLTVTVYGHT